MAGGVGDVDCRRHAEMSREARHGLGVQSALLMSIRSVWVSVVTSLTLRSSIGSLCDRRSRTGLDFDIVDS